MTEEIVQRIRDYIDEGAIVPVHDGKYVRYYFSKDNVDPVKLDHVRKIHTIGSPGCKHWDGYCMGERTALHYYPSQRRQNWRISALFLAAIVAAVAYALLIGGVL